MRCPNCDAEIPDVSRFCLSRGREIPPPKSIHARDEANPDPQGHAMLLMMLSFMVFFFMLVPILLGLWIGAGLMAGIGCVLVFAGVYLIKSNKAQIERAREEKAAKIKCRYCGSLNEQDSLRCESCGATL